MLPKFLTRKPDYNSLTPEWLTARGYTRLFERTSRTSRRRKATTALVVALICSLLPVYWISSSLVRGVSLSTVEIPSFADCQHDGPLAAHHTSPHTPGVLPPLYPAYHRAELALPQHDESDPFAGGKKYLWVANHVQSSGWGNFMQNMIMSSQLVYETGRSFVFDNFTWDRDGRDYSEWNGHKIPARIPLSAMISGPIVGGPYADGDSTPRSIIKERWDVICSKRTIINTEDVRKSHNLEGATARRIIDTYVEYIKNIDDPCVEIDRYSENIFNIFIFGAPNEILPAWPKMSQSPILQLFGWSTLAHSAFEANRHLFSPAPLIEQYVTTPSCLNCVDPYRPLDGLLAMHLRRGDFLEHCVNLCNWGAGFNAFNSFPDFVDPWQPPQGDQEERMAVYLRRCVPTIEQIVEKVTTIRRSRAGQNLKNMYIMSNGDREWLKQLKRALREAGSWELIATSRDMALTAEQKYTSQTIDMLIGERAQVFIGNGFSSMTSNIAMLRQARHMPSDSTRMW